MKCAEAVEWMHRYVDHDLNDEETSLLFDHIRDCSDCAYEFELLNELSAKLSELPDVTPRFSLVDRIMPQLDEIDRAHQEEGSTLEDEHIIGSVAASAAASPRSARSRRDKQASQRSQNRKIRTGIFGTVAAAVILGIFITQYEPRTIPNAELSKADQSTEMKSSSSANEFLTRSMDDATDNASGIRDGDGSTGNSGGNPGSEADMNAFTPNEEPSSKPSSAGDADPGKKASEDNSVTKGEGSSPAPANTPAEASEGAVGSPTGDVSRSTGNHSTPKEGTLEGSPDQGEPAQDNPQSGSELGDHRMDMAPLAPEASVFSPDPREGYGIASMPEEWDSPDGMHRAVLLGNHLYIYKADNEDAELVADEPVSGTWIKGEWSGDGTKFNYEADVDGSVTKHSLEVKPSANAENSSQNR
ncbi:anti-sigma factor family protein [Paenibacillus bouchesdurhonensis]|uniref:anti-sigma factor family protein n=1 Tax=Paenibacillus bouchesdurhonensis TaxID=1870990 RepID=UPI000DA60F8F|nr:anti-sigma factor [Paenibacillus bouchesdurhonensis]